MTTQGRTGRGTSDDIRELLKRHTPMVEFRPVVRMPKSVAASALPKNDPTSEDFEKLNALRFYR